MRILIADDNQQIRQGVRRLLSTQKGWEICGECSDGSRTLEMARSLKPDLVLMDMRMPGGLGGLEVTKLMRQNELDAKIIIMSQHDATQLLPRALEAGADRCLDKWRLGTDLITIIKDLAIL